MYVPIYVCMYGKKLGANLVDSLLVDLLHKLGPENEAEAPTPGRLNLGAKTWGRFYETVSAEVYG
jgi:hypothetical protein